MASDDANLCLPHSGRKSFFFSGKNIEVGFFFTKTEIICMLNIHTPLMCFALFDLLLK